MNHAPTPWSSPKLQFLAAVGLAATVAPKDRRRCGSHRLRQSTKDAQFQRLLSCRLRLNLQCRLLSLVAEPLAPPKHHECEVPEISLDMLPAVASGTTKHDIINSDITKSVGTLSQSFQINDQLSDTTSSSPHFAAIVRSICPMGEIMAEANQFVGLSGLRSWLVTSLRP